MGEGTIITKKSQRMKLFIIFLTPEFVEGLSKSYTDTNSFFSLIRAAFPLTLRK